MLQSMGWQRVGQDWATEHQPCASGTKVTVSVPVTTLDHGRRRVHDPWVLYNTQVSVLGGQTFPFAVANRISYRDLPVTVYPVILKSESFPAAPV